jgi:hypothetical protein
MDYYHDSQGARYIDDTLKFIVTPPADPEDVWPPDGWTPIDAPQKDSEGWYTQTITKEFSTPGTYTYRIAADDTPGWDNDDPVYVDVTIEVADTIPPTFTNVVASPTPARRGMTVTITFTSEDLPTNPTVQVNGHAATYVSKSASENVADYTYTYAVQTGYDVQTNDSDGDATISFSGTDRGGNLGTGTDTTALDIWALQWSGAPQVDATGTVRLAWNYTHAFDRLIVYYWNGAWVQHSLFSVMQAEQPDYRLWSMDFGTPGYRYFYVRIFESPLDQIGFSAGAASAIVPGSSMLPDYLYVDYLSPAQRGSEYLPVY